MGLTSYEETVANLKEAYAILCGGSEHYVGLSAYSAFRCQCAVKDALELLKEQESSEWLEDSDPGQEYGTTWACWKCMHSIHKPLVWNPYNSGYKYCPHCGAEMKVKLDG